MVVALFTFAHAQLGLAGLGLVGFPDGHITDYERATLTPLSLLYWVEVAFGLYVLRLALPGLAARPRLQRFALALSALAAVIALAEAGIPWYFGAYLGLDNGIGG